MWLVIIKLVEFTSRVPGLGWEQWITNLRLKLGSSTWLWTGKVSRWGDSLHPSDLYIEVSLRSENLYWKTTMSGVVGDMQSSSWPQASTNLWIATNGNIAIQDLCGDGEVIVVLIRWCQQFCIFTMRKCYVYLVCVLTFWNFWSSHNETFCVWQLEKFQ